MHPDLQASYMLRTLILQKQKTGQETGTFQWTCQIHLKVLLQGGATFRNKIISGLATRGPKLEKTMYGIVQS